MSLKKWLNCKKCGLHKFRRHVVIGRGDMPAKILFIGEAPGKSEDLRGIPFIGPSGKLLGKALAIAKNIAKLKEIPSFYITNVVGCRPTDEKQGDNRQPTGEEAWACYQRVEEIYARVKPRAVVFLGKVAQDYCKAAYPEGIALPHPAYLLRLGGASCTQFRAFTRALSMVFKAVGRRR